ncbi:branched-chain amino acid ABC transporter permease, partial [Actinosynnema sp. NPDC023658]
MRSTWRTLDPQLLRDVSAVAAGAAVSGASFGAISTGAGLPWWLPVAMSRLVFAGGAPVLAVGGVTAGG